MPSEYHKIHLIEFTTDSSYRVKCEIYFSYIKVFFYAFNFAAARNGNNIRQCSISQEQGINFMPARRLYAKLYFDITNSVVSSKDTKP